MSKVIRSALWQEEPRSISVPIVPGSGMDPELDAAAAELERMEAKIASLKGREVNAKRRLQEVEAHTKQLLEDAERTAAELVGSAKEEADSIRNEARIAGDKAGYKDGYEVGHEQSVEESKHLVEEAVKKAEGIMSAALDAKKMYLDQAEDDVTRIAMEIVDKVLPQHFIDAPQVILPLVRKALLKVKDQPEVVIHVSQESYEFVLMAQTDFQGMLEGKATLAIRPDGTLSAGDCVIETPAGNVDARLATQIELLKQAIQEVK